MSALKRGYVIEFVMTKFFAISTIFKRTFFSAYGFVSWPLTILVFVVIALWIRRKIIKKRRDTMSNVRFDKIRNLMTTFMKSKGIDREIDVSLREICRDARMDAKFKTFVIEYETIRYGTYADDKDIEEFTDRFLKWTIDEKRRNES